jgi:hypothetical protein
MPILIPAVWRGIVDMDTGMKDGIILAYRTYQDLARLVADSSHIPAIALEDDGIVHG